MDKLTPLDPGQAAYAAYGEVTAHRNYQPEPMPTSPVPTPAPTPAPTALTAAQLGAKMRGLLTENGV